jgi:tripartite-type tricarboxylate transporter receptor subunit TctC
VARARPGALNYASGPAGVPNHLAAELFKSLAGVDIVRIGYKGGGPALNDLIAGQVHVLFASAGTVMPHVKSGRLRALAITSAQPSALVPDLPTIAAAGLPGYEIVSIDAMFAPAKTPTAIVDRLNREIQRVLGRPDVKEKFFSAGVETVGSSPGELASRLKSEMSRLGKVIKDAGIRAE